MKNKLLKGILGLALVACSMAMVGFAVPNGDGDFNTPVIAYAEEVVATPTEQGTCGTSATWEYYEDTATLEIKGSGAMTTYSNGSAPWYAYASNIKKILVVNTITSISRGAFYGCNSLQEITLPFVGTVYIHI